MSIHRRQAHIDAPIEAVWELVANPNRHPEWIPRIYTGTFTRFVVTEAQGGTFVDLEAGMDPKTPAYTLIDTIAGKRFYRRWTEQTLEALAAAAARMRAKV